MITAIGKLWAINIHDKRKTLDDCPAKRRDETNEAYKELYGTPLF